MAKSKQNFIVNDGFSDGFSEELPSSEGLIFKFDNEARIIHDILKSHALHG